MPVEVKVPYPVEIEKIVQVPYDVERIEYVDVPRVIPVAAPQTVVAEAAPAKDKNSIQVGVGLGLLPRHGKLKRKVNKIVGKKLHKLAKLL